jgi:3-dehydrosphinganine reductase
VGLGFPTTGVLNTTKLCLPALKRSRCCIVNVSSMAGLVGVYGLTAYCAAKHALTGFSDALRFEVEPHGVAVHLVCPPEFESPMLDALSLYRSPGNRAFAASVPALSVAQVAKETLEGIRDGDRLIIPGRTSRLFWRVYKCART